MFAGFVQGANDVGGGTRCGNADDGVLGRDVAFHQFLPAAVNVVFGILYRIA